MEKKFGLYFVIVEKREEAEDFIIGDAYPTAISGVLPNGLELPLYNIFPISPDRTLLLVYQGVEKAPRKVSYFRETVFLKPKFEKNKIKLRVKRLYSEEVKYINSLVAEYSEYGIAFTKEHHLFNF